MTKAPFSAYVHFPFCEKKCDYCDFTSFAGRKADREPYIHALLQEIHKTANRTAVRVPLQTVYFGGGTPSLFSASQIHTVLSALDSSFGLSQDAEITMEVNPGTVNARSLCAYKDSGVNRLSIGIQSLSDDLLRRIGRIHTADEAKATIAGAMKAGFTNISCDLMTGLPGQTAEDALDSLDYMIRMGVPHLSLYALTLEEGTPMFLQYEKDKETLLPDDAERAMYHAMVGRLRDAGYLHYEISNAAKPGFFSRHNRTYWKALPYYGFGCGASGYRDDIREENTSDLSAYLQYMEDCPEELDRLRIDASPISPDESRREYMLLGFRLLIEGVSEDEYRGRFGTEMLEDFASQLRVLSLQNLIEKKDHSYVLTAKGIDFANVVFREFVS